LFWYQDNSVVSVLPFLVVALVVKASENVRVPLVGAVLGFLLFGGFFLMLSKCVPGFFVVKGKRKSK
jgi:hypothetical protein